MIVPGTRLLFWTAAIVLPFALLAAVAPGSTAVALIIIGGFTLLTAVDAAGGRKNLVGIGVELPPIVRMSKGRAAKIELRIHNERQQRQQLRVALAWPREIKAEEEVMEAVLPGKFAWSRMALACTPLQRGSFQLNSAFVEIASPLGFWAARKAVPVRSEVRVYPNLLSGRKSLAALFLNRGAFGTHAQRQVGKGRDFEKLREYVPGDGYDEIHWKATARRGRPITKVFQVEKTQEVYVIVDASRLSARIPEEDSAAGSSALEGFVTAALVLGLAAEQQGDLFGLLTFSDKVERFVRARNGQAHYRACRDALYTLQPKIVTPDFDELCSFIRLRLRRRALLVVLTALDDPALAESFVRNIELIRRQHIVLVNMVPPAGVQPLFTSPNVAEVDDLYRRLGGHLQWHKLRELQKVLQRHGVRLSLPENERLSADIVAQYMNVKQRQLL
ncbi:MAG TPA: DUF58 domain-containing protein [Candidatus Angelobacter sp.]|nr:DUF58 domain-containing protein [Candidatus Angelobacter sp.]